MDSLRERIARALWEQWRTLDIAAESCRDLPFDELVALTKAPPLANGHQPAKQIYEAALTQADAALEAIEASGTHCIAPMEPTEKMQWEAFQTRVLQYPIEAKFLYNIMLTARPRDVAPTEQSDG